MCCAAIDPRSLQAVVPHPCRHSGLNSASRVAGSPWRLPSQPYRKLRTIERCSTFLHPASITT